MNLTTDGVNMANVLDRKYGLENNTTPTGRVFGIVPVESNPSLLEIKYTDGKAGGIPESLGGLWTHTRAASEAIREFLIKFWDASDAQADINKKKAAA